MKRIIPIIILLAIIGGGYWWSNRPPAATSAGSTALIGSGTIEAETVTITAELGGRIVALKVDEGDEVRAGQILVELDKSNLLAQRLQLEAALSTATANLALVSAPARPEDIAAAQAQLTQAEVAQAGARLIWERAQALVHNPHDLDVQISQAEARVTEAESNLELAQVNLKRMEIQAETASRNQSNHAALVQNEVAQHELQAAQIGLQMADVALEGSQRQVEHLRQIRHQPLTLITQANGAEAAYHQAEAAVLAAEANLTAVKAGPSPEDIAVAQAQVVEAETALAMLEVQLAKQTLTAPRAGLISQKLVNPGELAAPGSMLLEISDIDSLELTVYIPETEIGRVKVGQKAQVYVDAYEHELFDGQVSFIAHEAEFTPRNAQTQEERVNLVFAVKIKLDNTGHRLKPGMPADAEILPELQADSQAVMRPSPTGQPTTSPTFTATPTPTGPEVQGLTDNSYERDFGMELSQPPSPQPSPKGRGDFASPPLGGIEGGPTKPAPQAEVVAWGLKVHSQSGIDQPVIAHLARGDIVSVIEVDPDSGWLRVQLPGGEKSGWISGKPAYVSLRNGPDRPEPVATPAESLPVTQAQIISAGLNVRSGPGIDRPRLATLVQGDIVTVIKVDPNSGWLQIQLPGSQKIGWISNNPAYVLLR